MANSYVTCKMIAERALPLLIEKIKMLGLVQSGVYDEALTHKFGDTIQIKKPVRGSVVDGSGDISGAIQDIKDEAVELQLNHQDTYPVSVTSKEMSLNIDDFVRQFVAPGVSVIAENINKNLLDLYVDIPYFYGTAGTTPAALGNITQSRKVLQNNNAPSNDRSFVFDADAEAKLLELDSLVEVDKSGQTSGLRDAVIGRVYDLLMVSDTMVPTHTAGGYTALADVTITTGAAGATSIVLTSAAGASTAKLEDGDIFTLDGVQYGVTAQTAAAIAGVVTVAIYPALEKAFGDMTAVTVAFADVTARGHVANLMFQKDAFAIAFAELPVVGGADNSSISMDGYTIRVVNDYDINNDKSIYRMDVLYGVKTCMPECAVRVLG